MSFLNDIAPKVPAQSPTTLLERLAGHFRGKAFDERNPRPLLSLYTADGHVFTGILLDLAEDRHTGHNVLFKIESQHSAYANELVYLPLARITVVIVHGAERFAPQLSNGAVARPPGEPAPTALDLRRLIAREQERLRTGGGPELMPQMDSLPATDDARANLLAICRALVNAVLAVGSDPLGKEALASVRQVRFKQRDGEQWGFRRDTEALWLEGDFTRALPEPLGAWLSEAIDAAL